MTKPDYTHAIEHWNIQAWARRDPLVCRLFREKGPRCQRCGAELVPGLQRGPCIGRTDGGLCETAGVALSRDHSLIGSELDVPPTPASDLVTIPRGLLKSLVKAARYHHRLCGYCHRVAPTSPQYDPACEYCLALEFAEPEVGL